MPLSQNLDILEFAEWTYSDSSFKVE